MMKRLRITLGALCLFLGALGAGMFVPERTVAAEAESDLQCWYFWWQEPQCTFCVSGCFGDDWDCCTVSPT
jgi:ABC-type glycerol-3-phosphate transport system substrate-binding protein